MSADKALAFDAVIVGAGIVGATLACLLGQAGKRIALIEARSPSKFDPKEDFDLRVSAINRASHQAFVEADIWASIISKRARPYESMQVWDESGLGEIRFDAEEIGAVNLGHIIENRVIQSSLFESLEANHAVSLFCPSRVISISDGGNSRLLALDSGECLHARLVVGADGPASVVRELMGVSVEREDYGQKGLVAVVKTEHGHQNTAWQRFMAGGPLALLPLDGGYSSIVWSLPSDQAARYLKLSADDFCRLLADASEHRLGAVTSVSKRAAFPLVGSQASAYVGSCFALVGDAAHTIHPLAGQGVNLGIKDAVVLSAILSPLNSRDWGSYKQLRRYERARKGENLLAMKVMEGFKHLFGHDAAIVKQARNAGLNLFNSTPSVKQQVMRNAMGL